MLEINNPQSQVDYMINHPDNIEHALAVFSAKNGTPETRVDHLISLKDILKYQMLMLTEQIERIREKKRKLAEVKKCFATFLLNDKKLLGVQGSMGELVSVPTYRFNYPFTLKRANFRNVVTEEDLAKFPELREYTIKKVIYVVDKSELKRQIDLHGTNLGTIEETERVRVE